MKKEDKKVVFTIFSIAFILTVTVMTIIYLNNPDDFNEKKEDEYVDSYININASVARCLLNHSDNITVVDCRGGCKPCSWNNGKIPGAEWETDYTKYYNYTRSIIVYDTDGSKSKPFCENLSGHTYGYIYNLVGGINDWNSNHYEIENCSENESPWSSPWEFEYGEE